MNTKHSNADKTTITRNVADLDNEVGNVYETVAILGKRANQISVDIKEELSAKLEEFAVNSENLEEVYENREQIEVSKHYERMPKPAALAIQEMLDGKIYHRRGDAGTEAAAPAKQD